MNHIAQVWLAGGSSSSVGITGRDSLLLYIALIVVAIVTVITRRR